MAGKKRGDLGVLLEYAGSYKWLTVVGCILSAVAMVLGMAPYVCVWLVAHNLADIAGTVAMFVAMVAMMFVFDWRMGAACLIAAVDFEISAEDMDILNSAGKLADYGDHSFFPVFGGKL